MIIKSAEFLVSNTDVEKCPANPLPEYAFIGRSNVGKSSLINMLMDRSKLAKTSATPGKTQLINHFLINKNWHLVDLPGYGYAHVSLEKKESIQKLIFSYLLNRKSLLCTFLLIDSRLALQKADAKFANWLGENDIPFVIVFTKTEKLSKTKLDKNIEEIKTALLKTWEELPQIFFTSSVSKTGRDEILDFIDLTNKTIKV